MTDQEDSREETVVRPAPPPRDFDPFTAGRKELSRLGIPQRPDPQVEPGLATLWERQAARYRAFEHLQATVPRPSPVEPGIGLEALSLHPTEHCGYRLTSVGAPFTALFITSTVPNLRYVQSPHGTTSFRTFAGLGFLDTHVEMTVDPAQNVTARITAVGVNSVGLPVVPGDVISASMCLGTTFPGRATYVLANETRQQTVNFSFDSGFPPAMTVDAGISRGSANAPLNPLAHFGMVYFDEISVYSTTGPRPLTSGEAVTMVDRNGNAVAKPQRLTDFTFRVDHTA